MEDIGSNTRLFIKETFVLVYLLSCLTFVRAGSHSLMALATYITGQTALPEFSVVLMLDDVQIAYYDSVTWKPVYRSHSESRYFDEEQRDAGVVFQYIYNNLKNWELQCKDRLNGTDRTGVHVTQRLVGCELLNNDTPGIFKSWDAFDGQNIGDLTFDMEKNEIQNTMRWGIAWEQGKQLHVKFVLQNVYQPICIKTLRRYLNIEKNNVMRKVKPRVRLMKKTLSDSGGLQISCLATGFYPRHINLTLFRDGQPVDDDQITGGEILPNGDGTYQMRKTLVIAEEELREEHKYNCSMKRLSLDNKLDIISDVAESDPGSSTQSVVFSVLGFMFVAVLIITALIVWRKRRAAGKLVNAGSHSLMALATYIVGQTAFPEFSVVLMLDDVQIAYYDSTTWKPVYRSHSESRYFDEEQSDAGVVFRDMYYDMKDRAFYLKEHQNHTDGVHVHQRLVGCQLLNSNKPGQLHYWDAFGGQNMEEFVFDVGKQAIQIKMPWVITWDHLKRVHENFMYENVYHPICMKTLRRYLNMEKNSVLRKVKPRVRLMKKTLSDSGGLQISCLATGFYPRHINLTLFRDGQPVDDDQITGGEILPNGDGTYQMRKTLVIAEEELREEHKYNCSMKHLSLDNKLDITFDVAESDPGSSTQSVVFSVLFMFVAILIITALIVWRKIRVSGSVPKTTQSHYTRTPMQDAT
ncbi:uncharacterized protein LOC122350715 [Puntigrus tetrazona]|uniref:uncharacterized protein LOC122350715 n=1 Tax=Puntigrus tetrazona TaxID=1606681 RepID=UPI001C8909DF|nr:uncharacterized protein LOC122350715 [Puntigrus tetrazona]